MAEAQTNPPEEREIDRSQMKVSDEVAIEIQNMNKWYGTFHVLRDINLTVNRGERIVICGPSGSGKSTLIRCINALEEHQQGSITVDGTHLSNDLKNIDRIRSEVGMVFQHFNLFPHLTILENCTLAPIWVRKTPKKEAEETAMYFLDKVKIPEQALKYPGQLSGGQQQRVAIARAVHAPADHAVRRADLGARPRDDQGGARHDDRAGRGGDDHALRDPRDGLCAAGGEPGDLHGPGPDRRTERARRVLQQPAIGPDEAVPQPDPRSLNRFAPCGRDRAGRKGHRTPCAPRPFRPCVFGKDEGDQVGSGSSRGTAKPTTCPASGRDIGHVIDIEGQDQRGTRRVETEFLVLRRWRRATRRASRCPGCGPPPPAVGVGITDRVQHVGGAAW
jgi:ABC-type ATPase involved in cell division